MTARAWPAKCASCGRPVRKAESHSGSPRSGIAVRHLVCALGETMNIPNRDDQHQGMGKRA